MAEREFILKQDVSDIKRIIDSDGRRSSEWYRRENKKCRKYISVMYPALFVVIRDGLYE